MKMKVFAYKSKHGDIYTWIAGSRTEFEVDEYMCLTGRIRISEFVYVDFPELPPDVVIGSQIQAIDSIITQKEGEHFAEIQELKQKRQELLAITHQAEAAAGWENPSQEQLKQDYADAN